MGNHFPKLIVCALFTYSLSGCTTEQPIAFYVENAGPAEPMVLETMKHVEPRYWSSDIFHGGLSGHRITSGNGTVIAYRIYWHGPFTEESKRYEKLTVFLNSPLAGDTGIVDLASGGEVEVFWSYGTSMRRGHPGCYGGPTVGQIRYERLASNKLAVDLEIQFLPSVLAVEPGRRCKITSIQEKLVLEMKKLKSLTPWEGAGGQSLAAEARP